MRELGSKTIGGEYSFASQYLNINLPSTVLERLKGSVDHDDMEDTLLYSRLSHELTHYTQNLTTSYGLWKTLVLRVSGIGFLTGIASLYERQEKPSTPIDNLIERGKKYSNCPEAQLAQAKRTHIPLDMMESQYGLMEGLRFSDVGNPKESVTPFLTFKDQDSALTAGLLLEFQAYSQQTYALDNTKTIPDSHADLLVPEINKKIHIRLPWALISWAFGIKKMSLQMHFTTYELVTLALNPAWPKDPIRAFNISFNSDGRNYKHSIQWEDLHPGWRFKKIADYIRDNNISIPKTFGEIEELIHTICSSLNWDSSMEAMPEIFKAIENQKLYSALLDDIVRLKPAIEEETSRSSQSFLWPGYFKSNPWLSENVRGPNPVFESTYMSPMLNFNPVLLDIATQMYFDDAVTCPMCFSNTHLHRCPVPAQLEKIGIKD